MGRAAAMPGGQCWRPLPATMVVIRDISGAGGAPTISACGTGAPGASSTHCGEPPALLPGEGPGGMVGSGSTALLQPPLEGPDSAVPSGCLRAEPTRHPARSPGPCAAHGGVVQHHGRTPAPAHGGGPAQPSSIPGSLAGASWQARPKEAGYGIRGGWRSGPLLAWREHLLPRRAFSAPRPLGEHWLRTWFPSSPAPPGCRRANGVNKPKQHSLPNPQGIAGS